MLTTMRRHPRRRTPSALFMCALAGGCADADAGDAAEFADIGETAQAIQGGVRERGYGAVGRVKSSVRDCTGTLVAPFVVLTSARCIGANLTFKTGSSPADFVDRPVIASESHPSADLALLRLQSPVFDQFPAQLGGIPPSVLPPLGTVCDLVGLGAHIDADGGVPVTDTKYRATVQVDAANSSTIHVIPVNGSASSGDTGAPLFCTNIGLAGVARVYTDSAQILRDAANSTPVNFDWITRMYSYQVVLEDSASSFAQGEDANGSFTLASIDSDLKPDLVFFKRRNTGTGTIEVHVKAGSGGYQRTLIATGTPFSQAEDGNGDFFMGNLDGDAKPDLFFIKRRNTGSGKIEVHVRSGASVFQTRLLAVGSGFAQPEDANGSFALSDVDGDGKSDLVFFKRRNTGTANVQVRVMSAASNYQTLIEAVDTSIALADSANGDFELANIDTDTKPDLVFIKRRNTGTGAIEVHERSGSSGYKTKIKSVPSAITSGLDAAGDFLMQNFDLDSRPELVFIQRKLTFGSIVVKVLSGGQK